MWQFPKRHPWLWLGFIFVVIWLPQWAASVWSLFSMEPLAIVISNKLSRMTMPTFSPYFITVPVGLAMFVYLIFELRRNSHRHETSGPFNLSISSPTQELLEKYLVRIYSPFHGKVILMKDAAAKLYTEARRCGSPIATAAEQMSGWTAHGETTSGIAEDILDYMATYISGKIAVYAKRPPSTDRERISNDSLRTYVFKDGATILKHILPNTPSEWTDLAVRCADLDDLIVRVKAGDIT